VRTLMDEVFGNTNFCSQIFFSKTTSTGSSIIPNIGDVLLWYAKSKSSLKFRPVLRSMLMNREVPKEFTSVMEPDGTVRPLTGDERRAATAKDRPRNFSDEYSRVTRRIRNFN
jgi:adenine-specific DNA-methyltransferase